MDRSHHFTLYVVVIVYILSVEVVDGRTAANTNQTQNQEGPTEQICKIANGDDGKCVNINSCEPLKYIFEHSPQPLSKQVVDQLKSYHCGFEGTVPKVCCPSKYFYFDKPDSVPVDVSKHKNIGLLNQDCGKRELFTYPWIALLSYGTTLGLSLQCHGTIINDRYILTTAYCANLSNNTLVGVRVGERNFSTIIDCKRADGNYSSCVTHQDLRIEKIILHQNYSRVLWENDIALLRVDGMIINENVKPVCLPTGNLTADNLMKELFTAFGFGITETGIPSPTLLQVKLPLVPLNECREIYKRLIPISKNQMCAGGKKGKAVCTDDSGIPLQYLTSIGSSQRYVQYGIVSYYGHRNCGVEGLPSVFTKVEKYMTWILDHMEPGKDFIEGFFSDGKTVASTNQTENQEVPTEQICKTDNGDDAKCININSCKFLKYIFEYSPKPFSKQVVDRLKSYHCGFEGRVPKVCCPSEYFYLNEPDSEPVDVSKHKNIGLLNQDCGKRELFAYPWIALLSYRTESDTKFKCLGTIINDRYILTAAACATTQLMGVRVGERNLNTVIDCKRTELNSSVCVTHQDLRIEKVILHHNFSRVFGVNDIALLRVNRMDINDNVQPICLPTGNLTADNLTKERLTAVGFGKTETGKPIPILLHVKLPLVPLNECRNIYKKLDPVSKNQICAGGENDKNVCQGDNGGPLQYLTSIGASRRYVQYGITSTSYYYGKCGAEGWPSVFTNVEKYMNWILDHMEPVATLDGKTVASTNQTESQKGPTEQICKTANGIDRKCISINSCKSLNYIFEYGPQPFSKEAVDQLKSYICGFEGTVAKVCCPSDYFYLDEPDSVPVDVSEHPNIGLLNHDCGKRGLFTYPWIAIVGFQADKIFKVVCHGTVLNARYILTTASCANFFIQEIDYLKKNKFEKFLRVGERNVNTAIDCERTEGNKSVCVTHQDLRIEKVILHHSYSEEFAEDNIALLRTQKMNITDNVKPICLPTGNLTADNLMKELFTAVGFGFTGTGLRRHGPILLQVKLPLVPLNECREIYKRSAPISKNQICAGGEEGKDICADDVGGPLQYLTSIGSSRRYVQYGITSNGSLDCGGRGGRPSMFTKVEKYMDWILDHMQPGTEFDGDVR